MASSSPPRNVQQIRRQAVPGDRAQLCTEHFERRQEQREPNEGWQGGAEAGDHDRQCGLLAFTHAIASRSCRSNSTRLSLKR
jgi:hypothetical protein